MFKSLTILSLLALIGCAKTKVVIKETYAAPSCQVTQGTSGASIRCPDGTTAFVSNGQDGTDAPVGAYNIIEIINPCGVQSGFNEVILRLANGSLLAHYAHGNKQFFTLLTPGSYVTTDGLSCKFVVHADGTVSW